MLKDLIKYALGHRHHRVTYYARGFMGNEYIAGVCEFTTSADGRKQYDCIAELGFKLNKARLSECYRYTNGDAPVLIETSTLSDVLALPVWWYCLDSMDKGVGK